LEEVQEEAILILKRGKQLERWFKNVKEAELALFAAVARTITSYLDGILNYFN
jgi:transposase